MALLIRANQSKIFLEDINKVNKIIFPKINNLICMVQKAPHFFTRKIELKIFKAANNYSSKKGKDYLLNTFREINKDILLTKSNTN